jgi:16S rRNA (guanine527-N7)-methyltransferase
MTQSDVEVLECGLTVLGLAYHLASVAPLLAFQSLLVKWNAAINLTAVRDPAQMLVQHLLDSLSIVKPLEARLTQDAPRILDVGSGGGLPGVVMAILHPDWDVTCVDAVGKKVTFIRQIAAELRLSNLHGEHTRIEDLRPAPRVGRPAFDLITSRAFASLDDFTRLTAHLSPAKDGSVTWAAMKGKLPTVEIEALPPAFRVFHVEQLAVPGLDAERCSIWITDQPTPPQST